MRQVYPRERLGLAWDEPRLVAHAGLVVPATLAQRLGLVELFDRRVDLGRGPGGAHVGRKALALVASVLAGGDCISAADALRLGGTGAVLGQPVPAPSTLGTFLRAFTWGHVRQLDAVTRTALGRAWAAGAGPGAGALTLDLDATLCVTYGAQKEGAREVTYLHERGYHPLLAVRAETGEVVHSRLRAGRAAPARGAANFVRETLARVRAAGACGPVLVRADAGFYTYGVLAACRAARAQVSLTVRLYPALLNRIEALPAAAWSPVPDWRDGQAALAELPYAVVGDGHRRPPLPVRLIVRRVQPPSGAQLRLLPAYIYHAFVTDRAGDARTLEAQHRAHAGVEAVIRELKYGLGLNHLPSGRFGANAAWLACNTLAHNLLRWLSRLGLGRGWAISATTWRHRLLSLPGRLTRSARRRWLHLPAHWPWAGAIQAALARLQALPVPLRA